MLAWPTHTARYFVPKCTLYCFFARESVRVAHTYGQRFCPEVDFLLFFARDGGGGVVSGPGWDPAGRGRGCLLIGSSDKLLPEGEEGDWKRNLSKPLTP